MALLLFCILASAASQSAECLSYHMVLKVNPVTLPLCSSPPKGETTHYILRVASALSKCVRCAPRGQYHNPRPEGPSNLRTLRPIGPVNPKNLHARRAICFSELYSAPACGQCYSVKRFTQAYVITTCAFFVSKKSLGLQKNIKTSKKGLTNPQKFEAPPVSKGTTPIVNKEDLL